MSSITTHNSKLQPTANVSNRLFFFVIRNWLLVFSLMYGLLVGLPFLPPMLMQIGWIGPAKIIYTFYSLLCHQLPQRSFFLFGSQSMYHLNEIQVNWQNSTNPLILRQFIGNPELGWKVAWSDRMVSMFTSVLIFAWIWWLLRKKLNPLPMWGLVLLLLPMVVDGTTHLISDLTGLGQGFRDTNIWLVSLANNAFTPSFYMGDALGSFNSWLRFVTGVLFGVGIVWFSFPHIDAAIQDMRIGQPNTKTSRMSGTNN